MSNEPIKKKKSPFMKTLKWIGVVIISLLLVAYFIFSDISGPDASVLVGKVNGSPIYYSRGSKYALNYEKMLESMKTYGLDASASEVFSELIEYQAFVATANEMLLYNLAKKNIDVSDKYLVDNIKSFFLNQDMTFRQDDYKAFLENTSSVDKKLIENDIREDISIQTLNHELFQTIKTSSINIEAEFAKRNNKRSIEIIYADATPLLVEYEPTQSELDVYFTDNSTNFVQADISWIALSSVTDATLLYDTLKKDIANFASIAMEKSEDEATAKNGGKVGKFTSYEMPSQMMSDAIFATDKSNTLLEPSYFDGKYYIVLVHDISIPSSINDVDNTVVLDNYLADNNDAILSKIKLNLATELRNDYNAANDSQSLSESDNYKYYGVNDFYYGSTANDTESGETVSFSNEKIFSDTVFNTTVGTSSDVIELSEGVAIVNVISESNISTILPADATEDEINNIERRKSVVMNDVFSQRINNLSRYWGNNAFDSAKIEYKLSK